MNTPCERAFWYLLPSLRRELTKAMVKKGYKRRDIAELLDISEASITHYLKAKRGKNLKFSEEDIKEIEKAVDRIAKNKSNIEVEICKLCSRFKKLL